MAETRRPPRLPGAGLALSRCTPQEVLRNGEVVVAGNLTSTKQKGTALLRCPSAPLVWLPQHSRRPAVIRPATVPPVIASGVPIRLLRKTGRSRGRAQGRADEIRARAYRSVEYTGKFAS